MTDVLVSPTVPVQGSSPEVVPSREVLEAFLDADAPLVRRQTKDLLASGRFTAPVGLSVKEHRSWVRSALPHLKGFGPAATLLDDGARLEGLVASEVLGHGDLSLWVKSGVQWGLFAGAVKNLGSSYHHERYLPRAASLDLLGCFAMTEVGHGSDVHSIETTATFDVSRDGFWIHSPSPSATKHYIGNAAEDGRMAVVFAQLHSLGEHHGVHAFVVPIRNRFGRPVRGVSLSDSGVKAGLNGVDNGRISFDRVFVRRSELLDRYGSVARDGSYSSEIEDPSRRFFTMLGTLVQGRVSVASAALSASKSALTIALSYAASRRQFGSPDSSEETLLLDYRSHQRRLLPLLASAYALHFAQRDIVSELLSTSDRRLLEARVAGHKALTTWHTTRTIQECREACGGAGYLSASRLPGLKADTDVFTTFEGDNTVLSQLLAKSLLTRYRSQYKDLDLLSSARYVAAQAAGIVFERSPARMLLSRLRPGAGLDRAEQLSLLEFREERLLVSAARRLQAGSKSGRPMSEVLNSCQDHLLHLARANSERRTFESFAAAVESCPDPAVKRVLGLLCDLYALSLLEADRAWFLERDRFSPATSKLLVKRVNALLEALRPHVPVLVGAFGIPAEALASDLL